MEKAREFQKNMYFYFIDYVNTFDCVDHNKLWKILKEMGIPDHLTCLLRNVYAGQEATVRTGHGMTDWFQIGKVHVHCVIRVHVHTNWCWFLEIKMPILFSNCANLIHLIGREFYILPFN